MGFLENLGLVEKTDKPIKKEEVKEKTASKKTPSTPSSTSSTSSTTPSYTTPVTPTITVDSSEYSEHFQKVFTERNFPGPDYYEYVKTLDKMKNMPLDDASKYSTAFVGLSAMGLTKAHLLDTANKYISIANEQKVIFDNDSAATENEVIGAKEKNFRSVAL